MNFFKAFSFSNFKTSVGPIMWEMKKWYLRVSEQRNILHEIRQLKANWIGHILRSNCLLIEVIDGKRQGQIEVTRRRGRIHKKLLDDLGDRRGYSHLKKEALDLSSDRLLINIFCCMCLPCNIFLQTVQLKSYINIPSLSCMLHALHILPSTIWSL
jgi:hypothetical protein